MPHNNILGVDFIHFDCNNFPKQSLKGNVNLILSHIFMVYWFSTQRIIEQRAAELSESYSEDPYIDTNGEQMPMDQAIAELRKDMLQDAIETIKKISEIQTDPGMGLIIAKRITDNSLLGFLFYEKREDKTYYIEELRVIAERQGIGTCLINTLFLQFPIGTCFYIATDYANEPAQELYKKMFTIVHSEHEKNSALNVEMEEDTSDTLCFVCRTTASQIEKLRKGESTLTRPIKCKSSDKI